MKTLCSRSRLARRCSSRPPRPLPVALRSGPSVTLESPTRSHPGVEGQRRNLRVPTHLLRTSTDFGLILPVPATLSQQAIG